MPLHKLPRSESFTFDEAIADMEQCRDSYTREAATRLRELVSRLQAEFPDTELWARTSHGYLSLCAAPDPDSPCLVNVSAYGSFHISYRLPESLAPWEAARVWGSAPDLETAVSYIRIAIDKSQGWPRRDALEEPGPRKWRLFDLWGRSSSRERSAEPGAAPNGGPGMPPGNSRASEGPSSVSCSLGAMSADLFMKWEYVTVMFETSGWYRGGNLDGGKFNERLNRLGAEGWELVSVFGTNFTEGATRDVVAVLKRPMP